MSSVSVTNNQGKTVTFSTGTILTDVFKGAKTVTTEVVDQVKQAGIAFKDAVGTAITPTVNQIKDLVKAAETYCSGKVEGATAQVKQLVDDAVKYCQDAGIKAKSTLEQVAIYLKANGPKMTVSGPPVVDSSSDISG
jgi:uncharacterized protein YqgV (UPF0045/DUF77 family)